MRARILIVDDERAVGRAFGAALAEHEVTVLCDAREACGRITSGERFDVILSDLMMPGMTGATFHAEVTRLDADQARRMVFVTGGALTPATQAFLDATSNERLGKPCTLASLRATVQRVVRSGSRPSAPAAAACETRTGR